MAINPRFVSLESEQTFGHPASTFGDEINEDEEEVGYPKVSISFDMPSPEAPETQCDAVVCTRTRALYVRLTEPVAPMWGRVSVRYYIEGESLGDVPGGVWTALRLSSLDSSDKSLMANSMEGGCAATGHGLPRYAAIVMLCAIFRARRRR